MHSSPHAEGIPRHSQRKTPGRVGVWEEGGVGRGGGVERSHWYPTRLTCGGYVCSVGRPVVESRVGPVGAQYRIDDESTQERVQQPVDATHGGGTGLDPDPDLDLAIIVTGSRDRNA